MLGNARAALRRAATPGVVVLAGVVALAETIAGLGAGLLAAEATAGLPGGEYLFAVPLVAKALVSMAVWLPVASFVLAGFYGALGENPESVRESLRAFVRVGKREYRRYLTAAAVSAVLGIVLVLAVWVLLLAVFFAASTGFDYLRYANGARFAARPMWGVAATSLLLALAGLVSSVAFVYTGPLVVRTDVDARRAPLAALRFVRERPRNVLPAACAAAIAFSVPSVIGAAFFEQAKPSEPFGLVMQSEVSQYQTELLNVTLATLAIVLLFATLVRALVGPLLVHVTDEYADTATGSRAIPSLRALRPGRRAAIVAVAVLLIGSSAAAVRVADVHPHNPPEQGVELDQAPDEVYVDSMALTKRSARRVNASHVSRYPNGTLTDRFAFLTAWDARDSQARVTGVNLTEDGNSVVYFSERVTAFQYPYQVPELSTRRDAPVGRTTNGWLVASVPLASQATDPDDVGANSRFADASPDLRVVERTPDRLVLGANGTVAARLSQYHGLEYYDYQNATFRAVLDPETGYLQRIELTGVLVERADDGSVEERTRETTRITYSDVGETDVTRPDVGDPSALEWAWDVLYY